MAAQKFSQTHMSQEDEQRVQYNALQDGIRVSEELKQKTLACAQVMERSATADSITVHPTLPQQ
jgi:hypothetical protein